MIDNDVHTRLRLARDRVWQSAGAVMLTFMPLLSAGQLHAQSASTAVDIHSAIRTGDVQTVRQAVMAGANVNAPDNWGRTPLIVALQQGKAAVVDLLLDQGASIALTDAWGRTPLLVATQLRNTAAIRRLLARGADVNAANKNDITPLIAAAQTGNLEAMRLLLEAGAAPDRTDNLGWTALMWATNRNDEAAARMLVEQGAGVSRIGTERPTALPRVAPAPLAPARLPAIDPGRLVRGSPEAAITIVEYTDFQCPYCGSGAKTVEEVLARYEGQVRLVVKHLPLQFHLMAKPAAQYFEALSLQSAARAWAFYDRIFGNPQALAGGELYLRQLAGDLGADVTRLEQDRGSPVVRDRLAADLLEAQRYQFDGVPAFIINGQVVEGAHPAQVFFDIIEAILRR
ncbi:MAG: ankyrin repeat domain-containing protein [Rhodoferax sp.]|nr:ankyrin repeat domain-containing protein [Rhodoferax sp.]